MGQSHEGLYTLRFDGMFRRLPGSEARHNAGIMCYGWIIFQRGRIVARGHGAVGRSKDATSVVAEYLGLIEGLRALADLGVIDEPVEVIGDAKTIIEQMQGVSMVSSPVVKPLYRRAARLAKSLKRMYWRWTPRKNNRAADDLTRRAMRQLEADEAAYQAALKNLLPGRQDNSRFHTLSALTVYHPARIFDF